MTSCRTWGKVVMVFTVAWRCLVLRPGSAAHSCVALGKSLSSSECWVASVVSDSATLWTLACQAPLPGISQARMLEWVAMFSSRGSSRPREQSRDSSLLHWQAGSLPLAPPGKQFLIYQTRRIPTAPPGLLWGTFYFILFLGHTTWHVGS